MTAPILSYTEFNTKMLKEPKKPEMKVMLENIKNAFQVLAQGGNQMNLKLGEDQVVVNLPKDSKEFALFTKTVQRFVKENPLDLGEAAPLIESMQAIRVNKPESNAPGLDPKLITRMELQILAKEKCSELSDQGSVKKEKADALDKFKDVQTELNEAIEREKNIRHEVRLRIVKRAMAGLAASVVGLPVLAFLAPALFGIGLLVGLPLFFTLGNALVGWASGAGLRKEADEEHVKIKTLMIEMEKLHKEYSDL